MSYIVLLPIAFFIFIIISFCEKLKRKLVKLEEDVKRSNLKYKTIIERYSYFEMLKCDNKIIDLTESVDALSKKVDEKLEASLSRKRPRPRPKRECNDKKVNIVFETPKVKKK